jgi:archaemetzincin
LDPALFSKKKAPRSGDWMSVHTEWPQSFEQYVRNAPVRPTRERRAIVLQPIGPFSTAETATLEALREYLGIFFQLEARIVAPVPLPPLGKRVQGQAHDAIIQFHTQVLLDQVLAPKLPKDAVCFLGITMADLFPDPSWNFVFGMASLERRVGIYSLARYGSRFSGQPDSDAARVRALRRALLVVAHETGHMFSLPHCTLHECLMNGFNSLNELDRNTRWFCPTCLHKLHWSIGFDIRKRYNELRAFYAARGISEAVRWIDRRLAQL